MNIIAYITNSKSFCFGIFIQIPLHKTTPNKKLKKELLKKGPYK